MTIFISGTAPTLPGVVVETPFIQSARTAFSLAVRQRSILLMDGPPGTGKSTCAAQLMADAADAGYPCIYIAIPERPTPTELLRCLTEVLTGTPGSGTKHDLENEVRGHLAGFGGVLFVDEVQNLKRAGLQELRYLHDDTSSDFSLVLSGWQAAAVIAERPDLNSRVRYRVPFHELNRVELISTIQQLDPRLAASDQAILEHVDDIYAAGNLRNWSNFVAAISDLISPDAALDADTATAIVALLDPAAAGMAVTK